MSLQVWLPLNGNLNNYGLSNAVFTNANATYCTGKIGAQALLTATGTGNVTVAELVNKQKFSIAFWVKIDSSLPFSNWQDIIAVDYINASGTIPIRYEHKQTAGTGQFIMAKEANVGSNTYTYIGMTTPDAPDTWRHIAFTKGTFQTKIYVNGTLVTLRNNTEFETSNGKLSGVVRIGAATCGAYLNDVRIYDHILSHKEVEDLSKGLVLHYKLDNNGLGNLNLALNSAKLNIGASKNNLYISYRGASTRQQRTDGFTEVKCTASWQGLSFWENQLNLPVGTKITYSFYIYCNGNSRAFSFYPMMFNSAGTRDTSTRIPISLDGGTYTTVNSKAFPATTTTIPEYHYVTFEWNQAAADIISNGGSMEFSIQVHGTWNSGDWACLYAPKIEIGEKPTPWSPNPTDLGINSNIIEDCSGYNRAVTANAITWSSPSPRYSAAAHFNGTDSYIRVPFNEVCPDNIFTLNLWFKKDALGSKGYETLFGGPSGFEMDTRAGNATTLSLYMASARGGSVFSPFNLGEWYMVTMVRDGTNELYYVNGELKKTIEAKTMPTGIYRIGAWNSDTSQNYYGEISDFRIYNTVLTADDIKELYNISAAIDQYGNIYAREFVNTGIVSNYQINKRGQMIPVNQFIERDEKLASIEKSNNVLGGQFYEY